MSKATVLNQTQAILKEDGLCEPHPEKHPPIYVLFTSLDGTRKAIEKSCEFLDFFKSRIVLLAAQTVPYSLPLDEPNVLMEVLSDRLKEIAIEYPQIAGISIYLCRDEIQTLKRVVKAHCPVVMSLPKTLWPNRHKNLARKLRRAGCNVIAVETE